MTWPKEFDEPSQEYSTAFLRVEPGEDIKLRFLEEFPTPAVMHWLADEERSVPCEGKACKYCLKGIKTRTRYFINVLSSDGVKVLAGGRRLFDQIYAYWQASEMLQANWYTLQRHGSQRNTRYTLIRTDKARPLTKEVELVDIQLLVGANKTRLATEAVSPEEELPPPSEPPHVDEAPDIPDRKAYGGALMRLYTLIVALKLDTQRADALCTIELGCKVDEITSTKQATQFADFLETLKGKK